ncbi:hypothetical protein [Phaeospirillum tilakii]|uniref:THAP4-like heme-binding beta-barrel domain-containing protein n=1 Tax=Phaeospirillum tilakii TaxID=741673 RepID=A0ABW5CHD0_9PROT
MPQTPFFFDKILGLWSVGIFNERAIAMEIDDFNGLWTINYHFPVGSFKTSEGADFFPLSEAYVAVVNGRFGGADIGGCTCVGSLTLNPDNSVNLRSVWDASRADANVYLPSPAGMTKGTVQIDLTLQVLREETKFLAFGTFAIGPIEMEINVERLRGLNE